MKKENKMKRTSLIVAMILAFAFSLILPNELLAKKPEWAGKGKATAEARKQAKGSHVPAGLAKKVDNPPKGWSQGDKEGWNGKDKPPGLFKKFLGLFGGNGGE